MKYEPPCFLKRNPNDSPLAFHLVSPIGQTFHLSNTDDSAAAFVCRPGKDVFRSMCGLLASAHGQTQE